MALAEDDFIVGRSPVHQALVKVIAKVAPTDAEVLITGPTGVGKELYAHYLHRMSRRHAAALVPINCGALVDELLENELFGHVGGAFTGARMCRNGLVAEAEGGTLFFDEVDCLSANAQVKLLRFLQNKEYRRLGEARLRRADVRVVAATNADLLAAVQEGSFREDLFFRLRVIPVHVPPLKERTDDIEPLLERYIEQCAQSYQLPPVRLSSEALGLLQLYPWPGNVRELENCVRYLTCLQPGYEIAPDDLPLLPLECGQNCADGCSEVRTDLPYREAKDHLVGCFERTYLENALRCSGGNIARAARSSGKPRRAFFELMRKHRIKAADFRAERLISGGLKNGATVLSL